MVEQGDSSNLTCSESVCTVTAHSIRLIFYGLVFLFGTVGNILVILAYRNPRMRSVTNLFIANLGVADLTVSLINVPVSMSISILPGWPFGLVLCKSIPYLLGVTIFSSVGTLVAIATDRYRAIVHPLLPRIRTRHATMMIAGIWIFASIYPVPLIIYNKLTAVERLQKCVEEWPSETASKIYTVMVAVALYLIPLIAISVLYYLISHNLSTSESPAQAGARRINRSVIRMLVIVVVLFAACWLPFHIVFLYIHFVGEPDLNLVYFSIWLMYANSACNPIVYAVFNRNYRREFIRLLRCQSLAVSRYIHCDSFNDRHKGFSVESTSIRTTRTQTRISLKRKANARDDLTVSETVALNGLKKAITDITREKSLQVDVCSDLGHSCREDNLHLFYETAC